MLRQVQWLAGGADLPLTGVGDLLLAETAAGWRLYAAGRMGSGGGLAALALAPGGYLTALDSMPLPTAPQVWGPTRLALLPDGGDGRLLLAGALRPGPEAARLMPDGSLDRRTSPMQGGPAADMLDVAVLTGAGAGQVLALRAGDARPQAWTLLDGGALAAAPAPAGPAQPAGAPGGANLLAATQLAGQTVLVTAATATHRLESWVAAPGGAPQRVQALGLEAGLGIGAPAALEIVTAGGQAFVVVAGMASDSLTVLRLSGSGGLQPVFHAIDTRHSRFEGAAALAWAEAGGRSYLVAGGGDDGVSLLLVLPGGRLLHLAALPWGAEAPGNVTALAMRAGTAADGTARLDILVAGERPGLARLAADLGHLAPPRQGGPAGGLLAGDARADLLIGGRGAVTLQGGAGDDILIGGDGAAVMTGGPGADLFVPAANGRWTRITDFEPGLDRIDLSGLAMLRDFARIGFAPTAQGARLTWQGSTIEVLSAAGGPLRRADFGADPLGGPAPLPALLPGLLRMGSAAGERLRGSPGNDRLDGQGGNDTLTGEDGDDLLIGGFGDDLIAPGDGNDTIWAGWGNDRILSGTGDAEVWAGPGDDSITGGSGNDTLGGGPGDDAIDARAGGQNQLWGGDGADTLWAGANGDAAGGGRGNDAVQGGAGEDTLMGGPGNDTVQGEDGADTLFLGMGDDQGYGGAGNDRLLAGPGFDRLWGGAGADRFEFWRGQGFNRVEDFAAGDGDVLALGSGMWRGSHGALSAAGVVGAFGSVNGAGDVVLAFGAAGTTVVIVGAGSLDGLADSLLIL